MAAMICGRPVAVERDFVRARDRTCRAPGCRRAAIWCDADHRVEYAKGGLTHRANLWTLCRHHRLRHERGFTITELAPGSYRWRAPNGLRYTVPVSGELADAADNLDLPPRPRRGRPQRWIQRLTHTGTSTVRVQRPHTRR